MKRIVLFILLCNTLLLGALQAQINITATAPKIVETGEQFRVVYKINTQGGKFSAPNMSHFQAFGPHTSSIMSSSYVNGRMTQEISTTYTYVLSTDKPGKYTLAPAKISAGGKVYSSNPLEIEVVGEKKSNSKVEASGDFFIRVLPSKQSVYKGEHIIVTLKLYTLYNRLSLDDLKLPSFTGFTSGEIEIPQTSSFKQERLNNKVYNVKVLRKQILYPMQTGDLKIDPAALTYTAEVPTGRNTIWGPETKRIQKTAKSNTPVIKVKSLPAGQAANYSGIVGDFDMKTTIDKTKVKAFDAITLKITFSGVGNFKNLSSLDLNLPNDFEMFEPKITDNYANTLKGTSGSKTFEYVLRPRFAGNYDLTPFEFSYFDTNSKQYKVLKSESFKIEVEKGDGNESTTVVSSVSQSELKVLGSDIKFIRINDAEFIKKGTILFGTMPFNLSYIVPLLLFLVFFILRRKQIKERSNVLLMKNKHANKISQKRLKQAEKHLKANENKAFYSEVSKALWGYLGDKLNIPVSDLSRKSAREQLESRKMDEQLIVTFLSIIDSCEYAQFAPSQNDGASEQTYKDAAQLINQFEQKLK